MRSINIHFHFDKEKFISAQLIRIKIDQDKFIKTQIAFLVFGLTFIMLGFSNQKTDNFHPFTIIGLISIFTCGYSIYHWLRQKQKFKKELNKMAEDFEGKKMDCDYEFTENEIKYSDSEKKIEYLWHLINGYKIYKDHLLLFVNDSVINTYIFGLYDIEEEKRNELLKLIEEKVPVKN